MSVGDALGSGGIDNGSLASLSAALGAASMEAAARVQAATITAEKAAEATEQAAQTQATAEIQVATIDTAGRVTVAGIEAANQLAVAEISVNNQIAVAEIEAQARRDVAQIETGNQITIAQIQANAQIQAATLESNAKITVSINDLAGTRYSSDQQLAGINVHELSETNRMNVKLAFAKEMFNQALDLAGVVTGSTGSGSGGGGSIGFGALLAGQGGMSMSSGVSASAPDYVVGSNDGFGYYSKRTLGGSRASGMFMGSADVKKGGIGFATGTSVADAVAATQLPFIRTVGVLTPAQIQAQANQVVSRADARTASQIRQLKTDMAGRGFSPNSPILDALAVGIAGQGLRAGISGETQVRLEAAKLNAESILDGQKALSDQYLNQEKVLIEVEGNDIQRTVGVLNAISQIVSSAL